MGDAFRSQRDGDACWLNGSPTPTCSTAWRRAPVRLAYKFGLTVFMENMRMDGSVIESAEFRHGPAEMLDRRSADLAVLVGTDESREMTWRTLDFAPSTAPAQRYSTRPTTPMCTRC